MSSGYNRSVPVPPLPDQITRPVLTPHEEQLLGGLSNAVGGVEGKFWCGGEVKIVGVEQAGVFYLAKNAAGEEISKCIRLGTSPTSSESYASLHSAGSPSPHGLGNRTVYDESYRLARELRAASGDFALNFDPLDCETGIMDAVAAVCGTRVKVTLYKMSSYAEGGFFKAHKDTPKSQGHIGSLVVGLPSSHEGGELVIRHEDQSVTFDWATHSNPEVLQWAFFFSDVTHEILPVKQGHRLTLAYDVYKTDDAPKPVMGLSSIDGKTTPLYDIFASTLTDPDFLPQGGRLAFCLRHGYPVNNKSKASSYVGLLKGADRLLHDVLLSSHLEPALVAVYALDPENIYPDIELNPPDEFTSSLDGEVLLIADTFAGVECDMVDEHLDIYEDLWRSASVRLDKDLIWCSRPEDSAYMPLTQYIRYGNEAFLGWSYAAAALIATVPPAAARQCST